MLEPFIANNGNRNYLASVKFKDDDSAYFYYKNDSVNVILGSTKLVMLCIRIATGKCEFTTGKIQIKKPSFSINRQTGLFSCFIYLLNSLTGRNIQVYDSYLGYTMNVIHLVYIHLLFSVPPLQIPEEQFLMQ
jgi:hypothetical protein